MKRHLTFALLSADLSSIHPVRRLHLLPLLGAPMAFLLFVAGGSPASAQTLFGTLSNFDVFNDTGQEGHGFEIELEGVSSKDITSTFAAPYIRYGSPTFVDFPGGVFVRYESPYDSALNVYKVSTPIPPKITPTAGHSCWTGGAPGYASSGCEHFGFGLTKAPTSTQYHWLIADPATPGALKPFGTDVSIAAPVWSVAAAPAGGAPIVQAAIPPPRAPVAQFGNAVWVKVFETESPDKVSLNHLVTDDPAVPQNPGQTEVEWELSQSNPKKPDRGLLQHGKPLGKGNQSVIRRFEFYKYTGAYDPQTHEALCGAAAGSGKGGDSGCIAPGPGQLGDYIGAQMGAAQLGAAGAPNVIITGVSNNASGQQGIESGSWVSIYGSNLSGATRSWQDSDFLGNNLPLALDGVSVSINGKPAAVYYISPGQLNVQAPTDNATGSVQVQVTNSFGSATGTTRVQQYAPGFFTFQPPKYVAAVHSDGAYVAPVDLFGNAVASRPAQPGEIIQVFGTGFGPTTPVIAAGQIVSGAAALADPSQLQIRIGGVAASVRFAGIVAAGEYQFNVLVPAVPNGDQPITADIGGLSTQAGLLIAIKN